MVVDYHLDEYEVLDYLENRGLPFSLAWLRKCRGKKTGIPFVKICGRVRYRQQEVEAWVLNQGGQNKEQLGE